MPEPISSLALSLAAGLATEAVKQLIAEAGSRAEEALSPGAWNAKTKKVLARAFDEATPAQLDDQVLEEFAYAPTNATILRSWLWNPSTAEITRGHLDVDTYGISRQDRANLNRFLDDLPDALERARNQVFDPEAQQVIAEVSEAVKKEGRKTRSVVESQHAKRRAEHAGGDAKLDKLLSGQAQIQEQLAGHHQARVESGVAEQVEAWILTQLDEAEQLIDAGQLADAARSAVDALGKIDEQNLSKEARMVAHQRAANAYLATVEDEKEAIPHLRAIARLNDDPQVRLRNLALASLVDDKHDTAEKHLAEALENDEKDKEALRLKADLLARTGRKPEAADLYEKIADREDPDDLFNLSWTLVRAGRYEKARMCAQEHVREAPESPRAHEMLALVICMEWYEALNAGTKALSEDVAERLREAEKHAGRAVDLYQDRQEPGRLSQAYLTRGVVRVWQEMYDAGLQDFKAAHDLTPEREEVLQNLAFASLLLKQYKPGLRYVTLMKEAGGSLPKAQVLELEVRLLLGDGRAKDALRLLDVALSSFPSSQASGEPSVGAYYKREALSGLEVLTAQFLRIQAYEKAYQPDEAKKLLQHLKEEYPSGQARARVLAEEGQYLERENDLDGAAECLREARALAGGRDRSRITHLLAEVLFGRATQEDLGENTGIKGDEGGEQSSSESDLAEALEIYEELSTRELDDHALRQRVLCLFYLNRRPECLELCEHAQRDDQRSFYTEVEARIYFGLNSFEEAGRRFKYLADRGDDSPFQLLYAHCLFRLGREAEARNVAEVAARGIGRETPHHHLQASQFFAGAGDLKRAVHHAYRALQDGWEEALYHRAYISLFVNYGRQIEAEGAAAESHREAFQKAFSRYNDRFPDDTFFRRVELPLDDPEEMMRRLRAQWPTGEKMAALEEALEENDFPVGNVAKMTSRTVPAAWSLLVSNPRYGLAADDDSLKPLMSETRIAARPDAVVIDLPVLLTLDAINLLEKVGEAFERIIVPQPVLDELRDEIERNRSQEGEDRRTFYPAGDEEIAYEETPAEVADEWVRKVERVYDFVASDQVEVKGATPGRFEGFHTASDGGSALELQKHIGACSAEAFLESRAREIPLYTEDRMIRGLARAEDVEAFGTRAMINALEARELISRSASTEAAIDLLRLNFYFPIVSSVMMIHQARTNGFMVNERSTFAMQVLSSPCLNSWVPRVYFGHQFLLWLWSDYKWPAIIDGHRSIIATWTQKLYSILREAPEPIDIPHLVFGTVKEELKSNPAPTVIQQFEETYRNWLERFSSK